MTILDKGKRWVLKSHVTSRGGVTLEIYRRSDTIPVFLANVDTDSRILAKHIALKARDLSAAEEEDIADFLFSCGRENLLEVFLAETV